MVTDNFFLYWQTDHKQHRYDMMKLKIKVNTFNSLFFWWTETFMFSTCQQRAWYGTIQYLSIYHPPSISFAWYFPEVHLWDKSMYTSVSPYNGDSSPFLPFKAKWAEYHRVLQVKLNGLFFIIITELQLYKILTHTYMSIIIWLPFFT